VPPTAEHTPEVVLQVEPLGQLELLVHFAVHCSVAWLQTLPGTAELQSASVAQVQNVDVELATLAQVFSLAGQSLPLVQVVTQVFKTGWQPLPVPQLESVVQVVPASVSIVPPHPIAKIAAAAAAKTTPRFNLFIVSPSLFVFVE
jgi:hypothetical protein